MIGGQSYANVIPLLNRTEFLPSCVSVNTIVWLHNLEFNETLGDKAKWKLQEDSMRFFEHTLEAAPYKTAVARPLTSYHKNHQSKSKTCWALLEKQEQTHKRLSLMDSHTWTHQGWPVSKDLHTLALC